MTRKPTIKDVARAAQVSTATVSRVLEQAPSVRPQTRERVLKAVAAVDYSPNVIARNLRRQETRSIFLVVRDMHNPFYLEVFQGVEAEARALGEAGITADPRLTVRGNFTIDSGHRACRTLAALKPMPTAVFCSNDEMAMGAINELRRLGLSVPEHVSVVGFDDIVFAGAFHPPLTTIHQPRQAMGRAAMRLLGDLLAGRKVSSEPIMMPTELIVRGSTAPPA